MDVDSNEWWTGSRSEATSCSPDFEQFSGSFPNPSGEAAAGPACFVDIDVIRKHSNRQSTIKFRSTVDSSKSDESWGFSSLSLYLDGESALAAVQKMYEEAQATFALAKEEARKLDDEAVVERNSLSTAETALEGLTATRTQADAAEANATRAEAEARDLMTDLEGEVKSVRLQLANETNILNTVRTPQLDSAVQAEQQAEGVAAVKKQALDERVAQTGVAMQHDLSEGKFLDRVISAAGK